MPKVTRKIAIKAPVSKVFEFVTNPENWTRYVTSLTEVKNLSSPKGEAGTTFFWTYRMFGMNFHGRGHITENVRNKRFGLKMEGSFPILETYTFTPADGGTELNAEIEYEMPGKILGVVANKGLMEKINKKEADTVLNKIKLFCEA
ncbi:MAG: hypothetical protein OHK006_06110 [Thermodesulfovibrionales bacterium]